MTNSFEDARPQTGGLPKLSLGWPGIVVLLSLQFALFLQFAKREIVWGYPMAYDQTTFLSRAYETYDYMLTHGFFPGLMHGLATHVPQGNLLHLQASVVYLVLGPSRLSSIVLNFVYFAVFQLVLVWVVRWFSRSWAVAYLAVGMLWTTTGRFMIEGGGITDFRLDFMSICLFGILICLVIRSELFASKRWAAAVGAVAAYAVLFRYVLLAYVLGIVAVWTVATLLRARMTKCPTVTEMFRRRIRGLSLAALMFTVLTGPMVYYSRVDLYGYYFVGHTGPEKDIRAAETGTAQTINALLYYPRSLFLTHTGSTFDSLALLILLVLLSLERYFGRAAVSKKVASVMDLGGVAVFLLVSCMVPITILTIDVSKSPVVVGVLLGPVLWLFMIGVMALRQRIVEVRAWGRAAIGVIAGVAIVSGLGTEFQMATRRSPLTLRRNDTVEVLRLYDRLFQEARLNGWATPKLAIDRTYDYLHPQVIPALVYERHSTLLVPSGLLGGTVFPVAKDAALRALEHCDFAILTVSQSGPPSPVPDLPFNLAMQKIEPELLNVANHELVPLERFHTSKQDLELYIRPSLSVDGGDSGWVLSGGLTVTGDTAVLRARPRIELRGQAVFQWPIGTYHQIDLPEVTAHWSGADQAGKRIDATMRKEGQEYRITLRLAPSDVPNEGTPRIQLSFDKSFSMLKLGLNPDTRQLVLPTPDVVSAFSN